MIFLLELQAQTVNAAVKKRCDEVMNYVVKND
jgi:hypothetical protein